MANNIEIESWLQTILSSQNLNSFSYKLVGSTEKGDGYLGDVIFVKVDAMKNGSKYDFDLVLKCAKKSDAMRRKIPIKDAFLNEITIFETIVPRFAQYQQEKGLSDLFSNSVARYFGKYVDDNMEVIALQNLKEIGYELNDYVKDFTRQHINLVIDAYAKFHAISAAFQDQKPDEFKELTSLIDLTVFDRFVDSPSMIDMFKEDVHEVYHCLKDKMDQQVLTRYKNLENKVEFILKDMFKDNKFNVIIHGDCWNNNFMFYCEGNRPTKVAILDWQITSLASPIRDLSYFLLVGTSRPNVADLDEILTRYYDAFADYVKKLGSDPFKLYPREVFKEEWKKYAKFGLLMAPIIAKIVTTDKEQIKETADVFESGADFKEIFTRDVRNNEKFAEKMRNLLEYADKSGILEF